MGKGPHGKVIKVSKGNNEYALKKISNNDLEAVKGEINIHEAFGGGENVLEIKKLFYGNNMYFVLLPIMTGDLTRYSQ